MVMLKERIDVELGKERWCPRCSEWWPADGEFFYTTGNAGSGQLMGWCKACYTEWRRQWRIKNKEGKNVPSMDKSGV